MNTTETQTICTCCGASVRSDSTFFAASGEVCRSCHLNGEAADSARFAAGERDNPFHGDGRRVGALSMGTGGVTFDITPLVVGFLRFLRQLFGR